MGKLPKLFERTARTLFYTALLFGVYTLISFEVMIAFGLAVLVVTTDELLEK